MKREYRAAIKRNKLSRPASKLLDLGIINKKSKILDYGCGKGDDITALGKDYNIEGYDPYWKNDKKVLKRKYKLILCTYVVCIVDQDVRKDIIKHISSLLTKNGKAYISVRRDIKKDQVSKTGSKQYAVDLDLPVVYEDSGFCIYEYTH